MGNSRIKHTPNKEFKQIEKVIWDISMHILNSLEVENNDPDLKFFYTHHENPSPPIYAKLESCMNEDCGRRCSKILLDVHEIIVTQVVTTGCACKCPLKIARKSLEKHYAPKCLLLMLVVVKD
jgi:hypothetical protein